mgnify:CR=1 FL=1
MSLDAVTLGEAMALFVATEPGPLVRTIASYASYYEKWSSAWEAQALLRAEPVAGDVELGREFVAIIDPLRYPEGGIGETDVREIRRLKARMEAERLPRGADPGLHTAALMELGLILFVITLIVLVVSKLLLLRLAKNEGTKS